MNDTLTINSQHPALPGHFPGQPVVPGVIILQRVKASLETAQPQLVANGVKKLKFLRLLQPDEAFYIRFAEVKNGGIRFRCLMTADDSVLADGHLSLEEPGAEPQAK